MNKPLPPASPPLPTPPLPERATRRRILIADPEAQVRSALRLVLSHQAGLLVVGEVAVAGELAQEIQATAPDIILLAWGLPGMETEALLAQARALRPATRVVVMSGRPEARASAQRAGADAFVSKVEPPSRLIETIQEMARRTP